MLFEKIKSKMTCDCLKDAAEDTTNVFIRRVGKSTEIRLRDFRAKFEKKEYTSTQGECADMCADFNLSMDICTDESEPHLKEKYFRTISIGQKLKNYLCKFKLKNDAGMVKYTPQQKGNYEKYHYDFYNVCTDRY